MRFQRILLISLFALSLAACDFSLAEDIVPPPGSELLPTPASTLSPAITPASPTPANVSGTTPAAGVSVSGKVSNGSGGALPTGLTITLHGILNQQETLALDQPLGPDGSYSFKNVPLTNGTELITVVPYGPVSFLSQGALFDGTQSSYDQPVTIYESSAELSGLSLDQVHIQAAFAGADQIQLSEIYVLTVPGNMAVTVESDGISLPFIRLPEGALQASLDLSQGSAPLAMADNGFGLLPGQQYAFVLSFDLPYTNNTASLTQPFVLAPAALSVIVPAGVKVASAGLTDQGANTFQGANFQVYSSGAVMAGDSLGLTFSGSPQASTAPATAAGTPTAVLISLGSVGLLLVALGVFLFLRDRRKHLANSAGETLEPAALDGETARLADAILALDERFAAGQIDQAVYARQRLGLKAKLADKLNQKLKGRL